MITKKYLAFFALCTPLLSSIVGFSQSIKNEIVTTTLAQLSEDLEMGDFSPCLNTDKATYLKKFKTELEAYLSSADISEYLKEIDATDDIEKENIALDAMDHVEQEILSKSGIDVEDFYECRGNIMREQIGSHLAANTEETMSKINDLLKQTLVPESDLDINLPLYKNRTMVSYFNTQQATAMTKSMDENFSDQSLQSVIYGSNDDFNEIVSFYNGKLSHFSKSTPYEHVVVFSAEEFDVTKVLEPGMMGKWSTIESVWIEKLGKSSQYGEIKIELHFK